MPSLVDTSVKFVTSWMPGTPTISNVVGQFFSVMDIVVEGADERACTVTVSSNVAKVTFSGGAHMAIEDAVVLIAGTGEVDLDGEQKISSVEATPVHALVFNTNTSDGVYSGTVKLAPMGWEKVFSGTNKAVYRSLDVFNERMFLRVSQTTYQRVDVRAYRNMSTVDTGTDPMPSFSAFSESMCNWWLNYNNNNSNPTTWAIVTDGTRMYVFNDFSSSGPNYYGGYVHMFGPMKSRPEIVDPNNTVLTATIQSSLPTSLVPRKERRSPVVPTRESVDTSPST